jgi:NitT/TauT family transport system ATP-binding protein
VGKVFAGGIAAVEDLSLAVGGGELVAVVGPSGCGKSTLLRLASGLTQPTSGEVRRLPSESIGYVFQDPTLLPWRTVQRNVELLGELSGLPREERARRARECIEMVGLAGFEGQRPRGLSGGMRMRASLARSLTMRPRLFLFDEPFGALDAITRQRLNEELLRIFASERFAGVFVTHSVSEAVFLSRRVLVMSRRPGRIACELPVPFPYPRPSSLRYEPSFGALAAEVADALASEAA